MKTIKLLIVLSVALYTSVTHALLVNPETNAPIESWRCDVVVNEILYGSNHRQLKDVLITDWEYLMSSTRSSATVNVIWNKANISTNFIMPSNYTPWAGSYVVAWQQGTTSLNISSLVPSDRDTPIAQIKYNMVRAPQWPGTVVSTSLVTVVDRGMNTTLWPAVSYWANTKSFTLTALETELECQNILPRWCGDGVIDVSEWETCDNWAANGTAWNSCSATCGRLSFDLAIKKYVNSVSVANDAQTPATAVTVQSGQPFDYVFRVTNNGPSATTSPTIVSDISLPVGITLQWLPTGSGWSCGVAVGGFSCSRSDSLPSGATFPDITARVVHTGVLPAAPLINTARVVNVNEDPTNNYGNNNSDPAHIILTPPGTLCTPGSTTGTQTAPVTATTPNLCPAGQTVGGFTAVQSPTTGVFTYTWSCNGSAVGWACTASYNPNLVVGIDLALKKYVNVTTQDAQDGSPVAIGTGTTFNYLLQVTNNGTETATGTTTVTDPGPAVGVSFTGSATGTGWTCATSGRAITCTTTAAIASGAQFPVITVPATTTAAIGTFRNLATVANPNENPANNFGNNNTDPANVTTATTNSGLCGTLAMVNTGTSLQIPVATTVTCTAGPNAGATPTFSIECGNGQIINASTGTCNYPAVGAYTAVCRVNGEPVANVPTACRASISPTNGGGGGGPGTCNNLGFTVVSNANGILGVNMVCQANSVAGSNPTYRIQCGNGQTIDAASGVCQYSLGADARFPYTAECYVNNSTQGAPGLPGIPSVGSCQQSIGYSAGGGGGGGGGGGNSYCGNGIIDRDERVRQSATVIPATSIEPWACTANYTPGTPATATTPAIPPVFIDYTCRVNLGEQCDAGSLNGSVIRNSVCSSACRLNSTLNTDIPGFTNPAANPLTIDFVPATPTATRSRWPVSKFKWIVGNGIPVFDQGDQFRLASPFPTLLQGGTTKIRNNSQLLSGTQVSYVFGGGLRCVGNGILDLGTGGTFNCSNDVQLFVAGANGSMNGTAFNGDTSNMPANVSADDVNKPTSEGSAVLQNNFAISVGYMNEPIFVRVSRPAVTNTAGGNAFTAQRVGYSVNSIAGEFLKDLQKGNFTVTSVTANNAEISGIVDTTGTADTSSSTATGTIQAAWLASTGPVSGDVTIESVDDIRNSPGLGRVGDMKNLYVLKKWTLTISGPGLILDGVGTILIEEGTLDIQTNISYANSTASWAFIVKKPNGWATSIRVAADVKNIAGSFLVLAGNMDGPVSTHTLAVDGNVNANISRLVTNRTFVKANESSSALTTGVTINYSTRAFKNPPPLLTQYIEQYNLAKISR